MPSILEQYRISDFLDWHREKRLELNPDFQRGSVWTPAARTFLIDTILRQLPVPKVYLRTKIDVRTKKSIREVVDGQQRMRAILEFADDKFVLSKRAGEFAGLRYSTLSEEQQEGFLSYAVAVDQLVNASDDDVLEVFARLNSYTVSLNAAEKRHARFQGEYKFVVRAASRRWTVLWERFEVLTVRERVRMQDDSLTAEMLGILLEGVSDGGQSRIDAIYKRYDKSFPAEGDPLGKLDAVLEFIVANVAELLVGSAILRPPHLLMAFAAMAHAMVAIPQGELLEMPTRPVLGPANRDQIIESLQFLGSVIDSDQPPAGYEEFWKASKATTQRIASRRIRFPYYVRAVATQPV